MLLLLLTGGSGLPGEAEPSAALSPSLLNAAADSYDGKIVKVRGYITLAPEAHVLYESKALDVAFARKIGPPTNGHFDAKAYMKYCLTIGNPAFLYRHAAFFNGKTMTFKGQFVKNYLHDNLFDPGACPLPTAVIIDVDDLKRRYPGAAKEPGLMRQPLRSAHISDGRRVYRT